MNTSKFKFYSGFQSIPRDVLQSVVEIYRQAFSEPPFCQEWPEELVWEKLKQELTGEDTFLSILCGDEQDPVAGFCWGALIRREDFVARIKQTIRCTPHDEETLHSMAARLEAQFVIIDRLVKIPKYRGGGMFSILALLKPARRLVLTKKVGALCFTTRGSRMAPILTGPIQVQELGFVGKVGFYFISLERILAWGLELIEPPKRDK
jgi:hypothetical protein